MLLLDRKLFCSGVLEKHMDHVVVIKSRFVPRFDIIGWFDGDKLKEFTEALKSQGWIGP